MPETKDGGFLLDDSDLEYVKIVPPKKPKVKDLVRVKERIKRFIYQAEDQVVVVSKPSTRR